MQLIYQYVWIIPILPCLTASILGLGLLSNRNSFRRERWFSFYLSTCFLVLTMLLSCVNFWQQISSNSAHCQLWNWITINTIALDIGYLVDPLSSIMLVLVTSIGLLVMIYTHGYMSHDQGYVRFYAYLSLFTASMLGLVLSPNLIQIYVFWELVGMCSYLLVGFWFTRPSAAYACQKAFVTNRVGDFGLLLGILGFYWLTNSLEFDTITNRIQELLVDKSVNINYVIICSILLLLGPIAKSAQFPLHVWLPDAMEGPTPISALIHAATMVAAGIFLIARLLPLFQQVGVIMDIISWIGAVTAVLGASIALAQKDLKRGLAYSTMSQLGYMVLALGLGSYQAALFHLITHAYSKALLFLGSGSVIHGLEPVIGYNPNKSQNMTYMGGLRSYMPITSLTFLIGTLSLCGIPPFACFWSKDAILADAWHKFPVLGWVAWFTAGLTAFYMFRIYFITFEGQFRGSLTNVDRLEDQLQISKSVSLISFENKTRIKNKKKEKSVQPHESSQSMVLPLIILATAASFVGIIGAPLFYNESLISYWLLVNNPSLTHSNTDWYEFILTSFPSVSIGILGAFLAWIIYGPHVSRLKNGLSIDPTTQGWPNSILSTVYNWSLRRAYIDEIYEKTFVWITRFVAKNLALIDEWGIDGIVNLGGLFTLLGGETTRYLETGRTTAYIFFITFVFVLLLNVIRIQ